MPINEIAEGVFETDELKSIEALPSSIPYNKGYIGIGVLGTDSLAEKDAIVAWFVKQAQIHGRWIALRLDRLQNNLTRYCLSEESVGIPIHLWPSGNLVPYLTQLVNEGYLGITKVAEGVPAMEAVAIGPTRKLEQALVAYKQRSH